VAKSFPQFSRQAALFSLYVFARPGEQEKTEITDGES
jgi:hypothetical protein